MKRKSNGGLALAIAAGTAGLISLNGSSARADLLLYEPFDYTIGAGLGGTGTSPIGQTNTASGATWYGRQTGAAYNQANDSTVVSGSLSYAGLASSAGNAVSVGRTSGSTQLSTDSIAIPGGPITSGSVYYSMLVNVNNTTPLSGNSPFRFAFASLSIDSSTAADANTVPSSYINQNNKPLPAGLWLRSQSVGGQGVYQFGPGKQNGDGIGNSNGAQGWQSATPTSNQTGTNVSGAGQIAPSDTYFVVMKYTFGDTVLTAPGGTNVGQNTNQKDTVSIYINPIASTLGSSAGEAAAATPTGAYYSATNTFAGLVNVDAGTIKSFFLNGHVMTSQSTTASLTVDELRIGTSWADVTPAAAPAGVTYYWDVNGNVGGAGGTAPEGVWDGVENNFNTNSTGGSGTFAWDPTPADTVVFSAGGGATGNFTVSVSGTRTAAAINVEEGNVTLGGGTLAVPAFDVAADASAIVLSTLNGGPANSITKTGPGTLALVGANTYTGGTTVNGGSLLIGHADALNGGSLSLADTTSAQITSGLPKAVTISTLTTAGSGKLDVTDNSMVVKGMTATQVRAQLQAGYNAGGWNGPTGIVSTSAAASTETSVGYASNAALGLTEFKGVSGLDGDDVIVKYTYAGDANLDGKVDIGDLGLLAGAWQQLTGKVWFDGDFTYDGAVNIGDLGLLAGNWQKGTAGNPNDPLMTFDEAMAHFAAFNGVVVPEPASLSLLALGGLAALGRRRRAARAPESSEGRLR